MGYSIWIKGNEVEVSEEVYRCYWQGARKERYFTESDIHNRTFSYDALDGDGLNGSDLFGDERMPSVEDQVIQELEYRELMKAMGKLDEEEQKLIGRLYYYGDTLRMIARQERISPSTLQYRHQKILLKLRKQLKNKGGLNYE